MPRLIKFPEVSDKSHGVNQNVQAPAQALFPKPVLPGIWAEDEIDNLIEIEIKARDLGLRGDARRRFHQGISSETHQDRRAR